MIRRAGAMVAVVGVVLVVAATAAAHPLGNFTTNHYDEVVLSGDSVYVLSVLDLAEIPTFQARTRVREQGRARYAAGLANEVADGLEPRSTERAAAPRAAPPVDLPRRRGRAPHEPARGGARRRPARPRRTHGVAAQHVALRADRLARDRDQGRAGCSARALDRTVAWRQRPAPLVSSWPPSARWTWRAQPLDRYRVRERAVRRPSARRRRRLPRSPATAVSPR